MKRLIALITPSALLIALVALPNVAFGQTFVPLTSLPAVQAVAESADLAAFLNNIYKICVGLAAALAVLQIMRGGMEYMLGDSFTEKKHAKHVITMAILGLLLVLSPVIVFSIINPDILDLRIGAERLGGEGGGNSNGAGGATGDTGTGTGTEDSGNSNDTSNSLPATKEGCEAGGYSWRTTETRPEGRCYDFQKTADESGDLPNCDDGFHVEIPVGGTATCAADTPPEMETVTWTGAFPGNVIWAGYVPNGEGSYWFQTRYFPTDGRVTNTDLVRACQNDTNHQTGYASPVTAVNCITADSKGSGTFEVPRPTSRLGSPEVEVKPQPGS